MTAVRLIAATAAVLAAVQEPSRVHRIALGCCAVVIVLPVLLS